MQFVAGCLEGYLCVIDAFLIWGVACTASQHKMPVGQMIMSTLGI